MQRLRRFSLRHDPQHLLVIGAMSILAGIGCNPTDSRQSQTEDTSGLDGLLGSQVLGYRPAVPLSSPDAIPTDLVAVGIPPNQIQLTWVDHAADETNYVVQRNVGDTGWQDHIVLAANATFFIEWEVQPGIQYCYRVVAVNATMASEPSLASCIVLPGTDQLTDPDSSDSDTDTTLGGTSGKPAAPTDLRLSMVQGQVGLAWTDNAMNEDGFQVWRFDTKAGSWASHASVPADTTDFVDLAGEPGHSYCYRIRAFNSVGTSSFAALKCIGVPTGTSGNDTPTSDTDASTPSSALAKPAAPTGLTLSIVEGKVHLAWIDKAVNEDGFDVWRYDATTGQWVSHASLATDSTDYLDASSEPGSSCCYKVRAFNSAGASSFASLKCISIPKTVDPGDDPGTGGPYVIWFHDCEASSVESLETAVRCPAVTHIMLGAMHSNDLDWRTNPKTQEAIRIVRNSSARLIWCRGLTPYYELNGFTLKDMYDPQFYIEAIRNVRSEARTIGADATALDTEPYGNSPFKELAKGGQLPSEEVVAMISNAVNAALREADQVDFLLPAGSFQAGHPYQVLAHLGQRRIAESSYSGRPAYIAAIPYAYEITGLYLSLTDRNEGAAERQYTPVCEVFQRPELWTGKAGLFLFPLREVDAQVASKLLACYDQFGPIVPANP